MCFQCEPQRKIVAPWPGTAYFRQAIMLHSMVSVSPNIYVYVCTSYCILYCIFRTLTYPSSSSGHEEYDPDERNFHSKQQQVFIVRRINSQRAIILRMLSSPSYGTAIPCRALYCIVHCPRGKHRKNVDAIIVMPNNVQEEDVTWKTICKGSKKRCTAINRVRGTTTIQEGRRSACRQGILK